MATYPVMKQSYEKNLPLKIYFAGAIRGGREDAELYACLIRFLSSFGTVLTEHVGDAGLLQDEQDLSEVQIYDRDMEWLQLADLVIAEVTTPSLGVGYEIGIAEKQGKEIFCLYRSSSATSLSAMIAGNPALQVRTYGNLEEAEKLIGEAIASFLERNALEQTTLEVK